MNRLFHYLFRCIEAIVLVVAVIMCLVVFFQVVLRYVLDQPFGWTEELGRVTFLVFVMLGAALAYRDDRHLGLDILEIQLSPKVRLFFVALKRIFVLLFAAVMIRQGFVLVNSLFAQTPILGIPFSKLYLIFPATMILILIIAIVQFYRDIGQIIHYGKGARGLAVQPMPPPKPNGSPHLD